MRRGWGKAFFANFTIVRAHYDERFIHMPEFYHAGCKYFLQLHGDMVFQFQFGHNCRMLPLGRRQIAQKDNRYPDILCKTIFFGNTPHLRK